MRKRVIGCLLTCVVAASFTIAILPASGVTAAAAPDRRPTPSPTPTSTPTPTPTPAPTPTPTPAPFPTGTSDESVTFQNDYGHDGAQPGDTLAPPLQRRWTVDLGGDVSYPLIAGGRVFAVANLHGGGTGARLFALDAGTGAIDWSTDLGVPGTITFSASIAFDAGRVFAVNATDNRLRAFDAATGALRWTSPPPLAGSNYPVSPPTAVAGVVYYQSGYQLVALRESDGTQLWATQANSEADGPPAVDATSVYEAYPCSGAYAWAAASGTLDWKYEPCYGGGGGSTPALYGGKLYARGNLHDDVPAVYAAETGTPTGNFNARTPEAFDAGTGFFLSGTSTNASIGGTLSSVDLASGASKWTFTGDGGLRSNVLVANGVVYVGSGSGDVYALAESSGQQVWSDNAGAPLLWTGEARSSAPATGMAIGEGLLAVPASNLLAVYASCGSSCPAPGGVSVAAAGPQSSFWFAAGSTATGFGEQIDLYSPHASGPAAIDYYTASGKTSTAVQLSAGQPVTVDVAGVVGTGQQVAAHVQLPGPGVAERVLRFPAGSNQGSSDRVGASALSSWWDFVAGSTTTTTDEYLTLLNPSGAAVTVNLAYITDAGSSTKTLSLPPLTPTTVEVFSGDPTASVASCVPSGAGADCGVGRGIAGVSVLVTAQNSAQIVAERTLYLNGYDFGAGPIAAGDTAFGTNGQDAATLAAGNTLPGFSPHLVLVNTNGFAVTQDVTWFADSATGVVKSYSLPAGGRLDIDLSDPNAGVGAGHSSVSAFVNAYPGVLAERVTYLVHDFGSGTVSGLQTSYGSVTPTNVSGFSAGSTLPGDATFLTILAASGPTVVTLTLDGGAGPVRHVFSIPADGTIVVPLSDPGQGIGPGYAQVAAVVTGSTQLVVEKTSYSTNASTSGAADTMPAWPAVTGVSYSWSLEFF